MKTHRLPPGVLAALAVTTAVGCFHKPNVDGDKLLCMVDDDCLPGYVCPKPPNDTTLNFVLCVKSLAQGIDASVSDTTRAETATTEASAPIDGQLGTDGAPATDGVVPPLDGAQAIDSSSDRAAPSDSAADAPSDTISTLPLDGSADRNPNADPPTATTDAPSPDLPLQSSDAPITDTGGTPGMGGTTGSGGTIATSIDGSSSTGGTTSTGGTATVSTGGNTSTGGNAGTGGNSQPPASVDCPDTSSYSNLIQAQYGGTFIPVDNVSGKNYYMTANWWGKYSNESESVTGVGFTMTNPTNAATTNNDPMGFPSIYIGAYSSHNTTGSNLPKLVSELTSVPTILSTNADTMGTSNYNAAYDVWMTSSNAVVTGSSPGTGGAYLMVWLFKPSDHQPRGTLRANGSVIDGVKGVWDVWYDNTNPPCVSYVSSDKISSLEFDLNYFIQDAVQNNYGVTSNQYLSVIFAGFEVWGGGDALQVKKFCANVK